MLHCPGDAQPGVRKQGECPRMDRGERLARSQGETACFVVFTYAQV